MSQPLYSSPNKRFYIKFSRREAQFHVFDMNRPDWRVISQSLVEAIAVCDRYYREALDG